MKTQLLQFLLALLILLTACAAPAEQVQPLAATEAVAATPIPTPDVTPSTAFTPRPTTFVESMPTPTIDPANLEPVTLEVIEGRAPLLVEEAVTRLYYALDNEVEPCMPSMGDQKLLTAINLERVHHPAYDSHTIHFSFQEGPDYIWSATRSRPLSGPGGSEALLRQYFRRRSACSADGNPGAPGVRDLGPDAMTSEERIAVKRGKHMDP